MYGGKGPGQLTGVPTAMVTLAAVFTCTTWSDSFRGSYGGRGPVGCEQDANTCMRVLRQKYIQISPNQKTVGFKHEDTLWWHPIYSLAYLSDNRCGCHLDDVVPKEFVVCSLQERLWGVFSRGSRDGHVNDRGVALKELGISIVYVVHDILVGSFRKWPCKRRMDEDDMYIPKGMVCL